MISIEMLNPDTSSERSPDAAQLAAAAQEVQRIEKRLEDLPSRQAEVVWLRAYDDLPLADIAGIVGCSLGTVKSRLSYGLRRLRELINLDRGLEK